MSVESSFSLTTPTPLHQWSSLHSELLWTYDGIVAPLSRHTLNDHRHGYWAWLLRQGSVQLTMGKEVMRARAGQWLVSPHGNVQQDFSDDARILSVHFKCQWPTGEDLFSGTEGLVFQAKEFPRLERSASSLQRLVQRHFPGVRQQLQIQATHYVRFLRFQQLFQQWLIEFSTMMEKKGRFFAQTGECDPRLLRAAECLHETSLDSPFPEKQLTASTGLSRVHLDRLYWKQFNLTTREYWDNLREQAARRILARTQLSIKAVGYQLGFKQSSHFSKWFHHRLGVTPKTYRDDALNQRNRGLL